MKAKIIKQENKKEFEPFKIEIEINSVEDALVLVGVFQNEILPENIDFADCKIQKELERQGFEI